jgi:hypothetical protein
MPNWCSNGITLRHADPAMIDRVLNNKDNFLTEFFPTPAGLNIDPVLGEVSKAAQVAHDAKRKANVEKYGYPDWYEWNMSNWGVKWDVSLGAVERSSPNVITASFESAWAPPTLAYEKLTELGFEITAYYFEPGLCFVGKWEDGADECIDYSAYTADTVREAIGEELDDYFCVSEFMSEYE